MGRVAVVGDVHGCARELEELLWQIGLGPDDRLYFVGDLVVRGPEPARVLELYREHHGLAVRGNHEQRLLRWRSLRDRDPERRKAALARMPVDDARVVESRWLSRTATKLNDADWELLSSLPLWLDVESHRLRILHAGVVPGIPIEEQDERTLLYIRTIDPEGNANEKNSSGEPWGVQYSGPPHIVFGHNAAPLPQLHEWATCIDTGCVYGGALTAMVLEEGQRVPPPNERGRVLWSVEAKDIYYRA